MALNLGGIIRLTYTVKNDLGVAANPSAATLTITQPDGTTATPSVTLPPVTTGLLLVDFTPAQAGLHSVRWATTGPTTAEDDVFVAERPGSMLISVDEATAHLNAAGVLTSDVSREQLQWLCMVATSAVEADLARVIVRRTVVETYDGGGSAILLRSTPALSITTVVDSGVTLTATDYVLHPGGILRRTYGSFTVGSQTVVITYVAGYADPPRVIRKVALNAVQGMWQSSQQAPHPLLEDQLQGFVNPSALSPIEQSAYDSYRAVGVA